MNVPVEQISKNEEILEAARAVFVRYGVKKATMDDIAKMIPITRTALYYYYKNKQELLAAVLDQELAIYESRLHDAVEREKLPVDKLVAFSSCYCDFHRSMMSFFKFDSAVYIENFDLMRDMRARVLNLNESAILGIVARDPAVSGAVRASRAARLLGMSLKGVLFNSEDMDTASLRRALAHMCRIFYFGLHELPCDGAKQ